MHFSVTCLCDLLVKCKFLNLYGVSSILSRRFFFNFEILEYIADLMCPGVYPTFMNQNVEDIPAKSRFCRFVHGIGEVVRKIGAHKWPAGWI